MFVSESLSVSIDFTDVTLVSEDTCGDGEDDENDEDVKNSLLHIGLIPAQRKSFFCVESIRKGQAPFVLGCKYPFGSELLFVMFSAIETICCCCLDGVCHAFCKRGTYVRWFTKGGFYLCLLYLCIFGFLYLYIFGYYMCIRLPLDE